MLDAPLRKPRRRLRRLEDPVQRSILAWLRAVLPAGSLVFHCPNAAKRSKAEGARFKSLGVVAGIPDLIAIVPGFELLGVGRLPVLIGGEVKAANGKTTEAQDEIGRRWRELGGFWGEWRSIDDARRTLAEAGVVTRESGAI